MLHASLSGLGIALGDLACEFWWHHLKTFRLILPDRLFIRLVVLNYRWDREGWDPFY